MSNLAVLDDSLKKGEALSFTQKLQKQERMDSLKVLLDSSGSMNDRLPTGETAYQAAVNCLIKLEFAKAIMFGEYVMEKTLDQLRQMSPGGSTPMFGAIKYAANTESKEVVIISDGQPTDDSGMSGQAALYLGQGDYSQSDIFKFCKEQGIKVNGIFVGTEDDGSYGVGFLKYLSENTGGSYSFVKKEKIELLEDVFTKLLTA